MARSRKILVPDLRKRIALGDLARHEIYFASVDEHGVITLTPAELVPVTTPKKRTRRPSSPRVAGEGEE